MKNELSMLGSSVKTPQKPEDAVLEKVKNPHPHELYVVRFTCPEFTSICPITSQPDFAHIVIDYVPNKHIIESKALKLFMHSFRNHGAFHEDCTVYIGKRIFTEIQPRFLRIGGYFYPRGGIPIDIFYQKGILPKGVWLEPQKVDGYRGRG